MKKVSIMQPYFLPYIGYWQLIHSADEFVVYDNIQFTKKGWFNKNRILNGDQDRLFTVPIKKDSDYLNVRERFLADDSKKEVDRILRIIQGTYRKAPYYSTAYSLIEACFLDESKNLFEYTHNSIKRICDYLDITTKITVSSTVPANHDLKAAEKVLSICKATNADIYINMIGGSELYDKDMFRSEGIELKFLKPNPIDYDQFGSPFVAWLSIVDVLMFNDKETIKKMLDNYNLL